MPAFGTMQTGCDSQIRQGLACGRREKQFTARVQRFRLLSDIQATAGKGDYVLNARLHSLFWYRP